MNNFAMPRPDLAYGGPGPILAVALQEQQASWAFYTSAVATHGNQAPLQTLLDSTAQRITLLGNLYQQFGVPLPVLSSPTPEPLATGWRESLERAMQGTFNSAGVYQQLVTLTPDPTLRREFERLQSDLLTRDLPALQRAWQAAVDRERLHAAQGIDPAQAHVSHGVIGDAMEAFFALLTRQGGVLGFTGTFWASQAPYCARPTPCWWPAPSSAAWPCRVGATPASCANSAPPAPPPATAAARPRLPTIRTKRTIPPMPPGLPPMTRRTEPCFPSCP
mgnify:CR=1 FL=1